MEVHLVNSYGTSNITTFIVGATLSGEYRSACRTLDLEILNTPWDINIPKVEINLGDTIGFFESGNLMFYGVVWSKDKGTASNTINVHCKDYGIYLLKNKYNYKFKNMAPEAIAKKVCGDFGISINSIANTSKSINRIFVRNSLYDMIMTSYTLSDSGEYMIRFGGKDLNIIKKGEYLVSAAIEKWSNLINANAGETLDNMVNTIYITDDKDNLIDTICNKEDLKYGLLSELLKIEEDKDYKSKANKLLKGIEYKIKVTNFGNVDFITGNAVIVEETWTGLKGKFYIDADTHIWKNGLYTNNLTLNYKNLMDEKESGSEEEAGKSKRGRKKKGSGIKLEYINPPQ